MRRWGFRYCEFILILLLSVWLLPLPALAHVPVFGKEGQDLQSAVPIEDPAKSRVLYGQLVPEDLQYYSFEIEKGERIVIGLIIPVEEGKAGFTPSLILIGPEIKDKGKAPEAVEKPTGYGVKVYSGELSESAVYEGFTPSAFYSLARTDLRAPESGKYYVAVSSGEGEGNYGIVTGYEETFTFMEWISIPLNQIRVYLWEGQSLLLVFAPLGITLLLGFLAIFMKKEFIAGFKPASIAGILAGFFFLGTGNTLFLQMLISLSKSSYSPEIFITLVLILVSVGLGGAALSLSLRNEKYGTKTGRKNFYFFALGIIGLFFWSGWLIGPLLAFEAALLPWNRKR